MYPEAHFSCIFQITAPSFGFTSAKGKTSQKFWTQKKRGRPLNALGMPPESSLRLRIDQTKHEGIRSSLQEFTVSSARRPPLRSLTASLTGSGRCGHKSLRASTPTQVKFVEETCVRGIPRPSGEERKGKTRRQEARSTTKTSLSCFLIPLNDH